MAAPNEVNRNPLLTLAAAVAAADDDIDLTPKLSQDSTSARTSLHRAPGLIKDLGVALAKMRKNADKAVVEHSTRELRNPYASLQEIAQSEKPAPARPLSLSTGTLDSVVEKMGPRETMEDTHFGTESKDSYFLGVCDGHGSTDAAKLAKTQFPEKFSPVLEQHQGNVFSTFELLIDAVHQEILEKSRKALDDPSSSWIPQTGTTAVISYIDKASWTIYTATVGDSEAILYRRFGSVYKAIPLSCPRNWGHKKEAVRAGIYMGRSISNSAELNPKFLRLRNPDESPYSGINISRALGDLVYIGTAEKPGIIAKSKITMRRVLPGDIILWGSDGLWDFLPQSVIIETLQKEGSLKERLESLADLAIKTSRDNLTVLGIEVPSS